LILSSPKHTKVQQRAEAAHHGGSVGEDLAVAVSVVGVVEDLAALAADHPEVAAPQVVGKAIHYETCLINNFVFGYHQWISFSGRFCHL
jgi:hypothetical protein